MIFFAVLIFEIVLLFLSSKYLIKMLSFVAFNLTRSKKATISFLSFLFFPGVVVHELSHAIIATILFVRVGEIEFVPQIRENSIKLGSVAIAKTDPIRRFLIGVAPLVVGLFVIYGILVWYLSVPFELSALQFWKTIGVVYVVFQVGNTMFSSKKDMEGAIGLVGFLIVVVAVLLLLGVEIPISLFQDVLEQNVAALRYMVFVFFIPVFINVSCVVMGRAFYKN